ncbi:AAC(3) family N-acetyltransferase [Lederbergia citrea]|uniref:Aminoglycoside N(3)-acetyltransferase n=1 Tax=Lederbergia citrea TaxID=2833581 RepID=A0A942UTT8_9BACI|nr:AAC(3) family N-acetyltransferase [Lederbergia citrea]MBS4205933.1 AAC(3) family N-acetyltransferase [Lederbergia citrea]MBS4224618.1 AAC(3) family N-acetyltransferase [Lederbergia citrea]
MHTKESLLQDLKDLGINNKGTLMVHSSYKSIGDVDGRADTVLDAFQEYMEDGLLTLPTHTWKYINADNPVFSVKDSPTCVGILTELFRKRENVVRSAHPTHSVAAIGNGSVAFTTGDEYCDTPCARNSAWGRLLDRNAQIMLVGVDLIRNTFIHGIEEWADIPGRLTDTFEPLQSVLEDGTVVDVPSRRHCGLSWSYHFWKVDEILVNRGAMTIGKFGDAETRVCDAKLLTEVLMEMLRDMPDLFSDNEPLNRQTIEHYSKPLVYS